MILNKNNRLNRRGMLRRKNMHLESYNGDLCILQKEEKLRHLFYRCPFAKHCWLQIGINIPTWLKPDRPTRYTQMKLGVPFSKEKIIPMCWSIWTERNRWIFNNEDPSVQHYKFIFKSEFTMLWHMVKEDQIPAMQSWLNSIS
jgi:hypothetical protein